jgi:hypothetical protein
MTGLWPPMPYFGGKQRSADRIAAGDWRLRALADANILPGFGGVQCSAELSPCGRYRYTLTRRWTAGLPVMTFVMLNPSTAAVVDDPTTRRCIAFARAAGCGGLSLVNLMAWRATNPRDLRTVEDPVGPDNDRWILYTVVTNHPGPLVLAWGSGADWARARARAHTVLVLLAGRPLLCLGLTASGQPRHPLYVKAVTQLRPFNLFADQPDTLQLGRDV